MCMAETTGSSQSAVHEVPLADYYTTEMLENNQTVLCVTYTREEELVLYSSYHKIASSLT